MAQYLKNKNKIDLIFEKGSTIKGRRLLLKTYDFEDGLDNAVAAVFSDELIASVDEEQSSFWRKLNVVDSNFSEDIVKFSSIIKTSFFIKF